MQPFGERRSNQRSKANAFQWRKRGIYITAAAIAIFFTIINIQFYSLLTDYQKAFGADSQMLKWVNRKVENYSLNTVEVLNAMHRLETSALRYSLNQSSLEALVARRMQLGTLLDQYRPNTVLWDELHSIASYDKAFNDATAFVEMTHQYEMGKAGIDEVTDSGETSLNSWEVFKTESMEQEFQLRRSMEQAVTAFRPLAESSVPVFFILSCLSGVLLVVGIYTVSELLKIQHRRYSRFELLVASISHDLRSPLQSIQSASFLLSNATNAAERRKYAGIVNTSIKTLTRLVDDIVLAPQGKTQPLHLSYVNLRLWLSEIIPVYQDKATAKGLELTCRIEIDRVLVEIDPERMAQSIGNLLDNAIKYTAKGTVSISARLRTQEDKDGKRHLVFKVKDTGPGISQSDQTRIFMPFERAVSEGDGNEQVQGMGLGLSIVQRMANSYPGGSITVQSELGVGSIFKLDLPVKTCIDENSLPGVNVTDSSGILTDKASDAVSTKEILVVDDEPNICESVLAILHEAGFAVDTASNGAEALSNIADHPYKVVITDIQMPGIGGFELANKIRSIMRPSPYLIAMTAYTSALEQDPRSKVFDGILSKPFDEADLILLIEKGMESEQQFSQSNWPVI